MSPRQGCARYHSAHGLLYGTVLLGRVEKCLMHPVRRHDPLCYPQARPRSAACITRGPSCLCRAWRWAVSPRVALPPRPWYGQRRRTASTCQQAHYATLLQFLPSGLLRRSRSAPSKTVVAPMARAGLSPRVALPSGPWPALRRRTAWACGRRPHAPRALSRPSLLPACPRSAACISRGPSYAEAAWRWAVSPKVALPTRPWDD